LSRSAPFPYSTLFRSHQDLHGIVLRLQAEGGRGEDREVGLALLRDRQLLDLHRVVADGADEDRLDGRLPDAHVGEVEAGLRLEEDRKSTRLNSSHVKI